jgi:serine/threonine protein kinase
LFPLGKAAAKVMDTNLARAAPVTDQALPIGTVLSGKQFTITGHLGAGGFGITYRAEDNVLGRSVVIKECFPENFCLRDGKDAVARSRAFGDPIRSIIKMFMREARSLAKLRHPNIVGVHRIFEENGTAYMVLDLIEGRDLFDILDTKDPPLSPGRVRDILMQLLDAIEKVHDMDLLHRDISPDNILIEASGTPVLIDFGAARGDASRHTRAVSSMLIVKDGYSPQEFYVAGSSQTPSSDLYALAATFYHVLSGKAPPNSQARMIEIAGRRADPCVPLAGRIEGYDEAFLKAIDTAMHLHPDDRLKSAAQWRGLIADTGTRTTTASARRPSSKDVSLDLELSLTRLVAETNDEVRRVSQVPPEPETVEARPVEKPKPAWIDEFNRESLARDAAPDPADDTCADPVAAEAGPAEAGIPEDVASAPRPEKNKGDTDWIGLAKQRQESLLAAQEEAFEIIGTGAGGRTASAMPAAPAEGPETDAAPVRADAPRRKTQPLGILVGLLVCALLAVFLQAA